MGTTITPEENKRIQPHEVTGGSGITLHVDETGNEDGRPILFIYEYSQSRLSWDKQMYSQSGIDDTVDEIPDVSPLFHSRAVSCGGSD
jgi:hypothetical protein